MRCWCGAVYAPETDAKHWETCPYRENVDGVCFSDRASAIISYQTQAFHQAVRMD
jgi:hypothetical protein